MSLHTQIRGAAPAAAPLGTRPHETPECPDSGIPAGAVPADYGAVTPVRPPAR